MPALNPWQPGGPQRELQRADTSLTTSPSTQDPNTGYKAPTPTDWKDSTKTSEQLTGLLSQNSDYMKRAETKGLQVANSRGLLNSSIAAGTSQAAAIDAAAPIAQADASTNAQLLGQARNVDAAAAQQNRGFLQDITKDERDFSHKAELNEQGFIYQTRLSDQDYHEARAIAEQQFAQTLGLNSQQFDFQRALNDQSYRISLGLSDKDFSEAVQLANQAYGNELNLRDQAYKQQWNLNSQQNQHSWEVANLDANTQRSIADLKTRADMLQQASQGSSGRTAAMFASIAEIEQNPGMNEDQKKSAIETLRSLLNASLSIDEYFLRTGYSGRV